MLATIMPDLAELAIMLGLGLLAAIFARRSFEWRWLAVGLLLIGLNNLLLSRFYNGVPDWLGGRWNWEGKVFALAATLLLAALPAFGWRRAGLTLAQRQHSLRAAVPVVFVYCLFFLGIALVFGGDKANGETVAFQLSMPGLEEEPFYRGLLLLAFDQAYRGRIRLLGVEWGWGAVLSCAAFGLAHALGYAHDALSIDPLTMALTALPAFIGVWLRYRTGSVVLPIAIHNFGNAIGLLA